jgi:hypothetical protein
MSSIIDALEERLLQFLLEQGKQKRRGKIGSSG